MPDNDFAIGVTAAPPVGALSKKPAHLVTLEDSKGKVSKRFISIDKPEFLNGFVQVKGVYSDESEEEISKNYSEILSSSPKELIVELMLPWGRISSVRNLVFKAK
jgi:hypothetical protein